MDIDFHIESITDASRVLREEDREALADLTDSAAIFMQELQDRLTDAENELSKRKLKLDLEYAAHTKTKLDLEDMTTERDQLRAQFEAAKGQEPVVFRVTDGEGCSEFNNNPSASDIEWARKYGRKYEPLYAAPILPEQTTTAESVQNVVSNDGLYVQKNGEFSGPLIELLDSVYGDKFLGKDKEEQLVDDIRLIIKSPKVEQVSGGGDLLSAGMDQPWSMRQCVKHLIKSADILLNERNYDGHGHEILSEAMKQAKNYMLANPSPNKADASLSHAIEQAHAHGYEKGLRDGQANKADVPTIINKVADFVELQAGGPFDVKLLATAIRANLQYGDFFKDSLPPLKDEG